METHFFPQYSEEYWKIREKKMTASHAQAIAANGKGLKTYIHQIMSEYYSSAEQKSYSNSDMERGLELEPEAAKMYAGKTLSDVKDVGFVVYNDYVGCSPDRLVDSDGLIEIKCPTDKVFLDLLLSEEIDSKYFLQMQMQMLITEREWCDYVVYNPNFIDCPLFIKRVTPDKKKFEKLKKGFESGTIMIKEIEEKMTAFAA